MAVPTTNAVARPRTARDLALLAALFVLMAMPLPESVEGSPVLGAFANAFHGVLFAGITLVLLSRRKAASWRDCILPVLFAAGLAIATELVQSIGPRDPSWSDVKTDLLGVLAATAVAMFRFRQPQSLTVTRRAALVAVALAATGVIVAPVVDQFVRWTDREHNFPVLFSADFRDALQMTESLGELSEVEISKHDGAVDVALRSGPLPGIVISKFTPNWEHHDAVVLDLENPSPDVLTLEIHIRDRGSSSEASDRYNTRSTLAPGDRQRVRLPLAEVANGPMGRKMRVNAVSLIAAYRVAPGADRFAIHSIRLE